MGEALGRGLRGTWSLLCYDKHLANAKLHKNVHVMVIAIAKRANIPQEPGLHYQWRPEGVTIIPQKCAHALQ